MLDALEKGIEAFRKDYFKGQKELAKTLKSWYEHVRAGKDISASISKLIPLLKESTTINVMKPVANLLVLSALRTNDFSPIESLLAKKKYCTFIIEGFEVADSAGQDISVAFPFLFSYLAPQWYGLDRLKYLLGKHVESHPGNLLPLVRTLVENDEWHFFVSSLLNEIALWRSLDISNVLKPISPLLHHHDRKVRREIASVFRLAAEGGAPFENVIEDLEKSFDDEYELVAERSAYALAWFHLSAQQNEAFTKLSEDTRLPVAYGALLALTNQFVSGERCQDEVISIIVHSLCRQETKMKKRAREAFGRARKKGVDFRFSKEVLSFLLDHEGDIPDLADFLMFYVGDNEERAKDVQAAYMTSTSDLARQVADQCELVITGEAPFFCASCHDLTTTDLEKIFIVGKNLEPPLSKDKEVREELVTCPYCQAWYRWSYLIEYDVNSCREDWSLTPLSPTDVREKINYEESIQSMEKRLRGFHPFERKRAAWALVHHYLYSRQYFLIASNLLRHIDLNARERALNTLLELWPDQVQTLALSPEFEVVKKALIDQLSVEDERIAKASAKLHTNFLLLQKDEKSINELLVNDHSPVIEGVVLSLWEAKEGGASLAPYSDALFSLRTSAVERIGRWARKCTDDKLAMKKHLPILLQELKHEEWQVRENALSSLRRVIKKGCRCKKLMQEGLELTARLLKDEKCADSANDTLRAAATKRWDISFALVPLSELLTSKSNNPNYDIFWTLNEALSAGENLTETFPNIVLALWDEDLAASAAPLLRDAYKRGQSVDGVVIDLRAALDEVDDNYALEAMTEVLTKHYYRQKDLAALTELTKEDYRRNWYSLCSNIESLLPKALTKGLPDLWSQRSDLTNRCKSLLELTKRHWEKTIKSTG